MRKSLRWTGAAAALATVALFTSCLVVPVPAPTKIEGARNANSLEPKGLRAGETTKAEAEKTLDTMLVPLDSDKVLWARYSKSKMAVLWAMGGYGGAVGGGERNWGIHNLFLTFGPDGKMTEMRDVREKELHTILRDRLKSGEVRGMDFSDDIKIQAGHVHNMLERAPVDLILRPDGFEIQEYYAPKHSFQAKPADIHQISIGYEGAHPNPAVAIERFRFTDAKGKQRKWDLELHSGDVPVLVQWWEEKKLQAATH